MTNAPAPEPASATPAPALHRSWDAPVLDESTEQMPQSAASAPTSLDGRRARLRPAPLPWTQHEAVDDDASTLTTSEANIPTGAATGREEPRSAGSPAGDTGRPESTTSSTGVSRTVPSSPAAPSPSAGTPTALAPNQPEAFRPAWEADDDLLGNAIRQRKSRPTEGWRALVYNVTSGRVNPGLSQAEVRLREQLERIRTPLHGPHSTVVASIKGGVGKTTVASVLGLALAEYRGDRVIAIDANPDAGTLGDRLVGEKLAADSTVRNLLDDMHKIRSSTDLARYTHLARRLQVLTSEQDPETSEMFSADDYEKVLRLLARFHEAIITDSGTGVVHSAMQGTLAHADSLVIVGAPTHDGASRARKTLHWLATHGHEALVDHAVVVISRDRNSPQVNEPVIRDYFTARCRAVIELPPDPHLQAGSRIDFDALTPATRDAVLELAATIGENFKNPRLGGLATHGFRTEANRG